MKELTSTSFGYVIAFLLPGMLGLYALAVWDQRFYALLTPLINSNTSVGPSVVLLFVAVGVGLCVSAVRHFLLVKLFHEWILQKPSIPKHMYRGPSAEAKLAWHKILAEEHYRYHQFYGGCAIAITLWFVGWLLHGHFKWNLQMFYAMAGIVILEIMLVWSAVDCQTQYVDKCSAMAESNLAPERNGEKDDERIQEGRSSEGQCTETATAATTQASAVAAASAQEMTTKS